MPRYPSPCVPYRQNEAALSLRKFSLLEASSDLLVLLQMSSCMEFSLDTSPVKVGVNTGDQNSLHTEVTTVSQAVFLSTLVRHPRTRLQKFLISQ